MTSPAGRVGTPVAAKLVGVSPERLRVNSKQSLGHPLPVRDSQGLLQWPVDALMIWYRLRPRYPSVEYREEHGGECEEGDRHDVVPLIYCFPWKFHQCEKCGRFGSHWPLPPFPASVEVEPYRLHWPMLWRAVWIYLDDLYGHAAHHAKGALCRRHDACQATASWRKELG